MAGHVSENKPRDLIFFNQGYMEGDAPIFSDVQVSGSGIVINDFLNNVRIGTNAGEFRTSGYNNILLGNEAARFITKGYENVCIGRSAMQTASGDNCQQNVCLGNEAMFSAIDAQRCVALGYKSARDAVNSLDCVTLGTRCGYSLANAERVVLLGNFAGEFAQGNDNICVGTRAGQGIAPYTSSNCVYIGTDCGGYNGGGDFNIAIGNGAGYVIDATSVGNLFIGYQTCSQMTSGIGNVFLGYNTGSQITGTTDCTIIGHNAGLDLVDKLENTFIGSNSSIGVNSEGNTSLGSMSQAGPNKIQFPVAEGHCTAVGYGALANHSRCCAFGYSSDAEADDSMALGIAATANFERAVAVGYHALAQHTDSVAIGSNAQTQGNGQLLFAAGNPAVYTYIVPGDNALHIPSDERDKRDIEPLSYGLAFIESVTPISFRYNSGEPKTHIGFGAQTTKRAMDALGITSDMFPGYTELESGKLSMAPGEFVPVLVRAVQELSERVRELEAKMAAAV